MTNPNLVLVLGLLASLTLANFPIRVNCQGIPKSGLFPFGDSYYDVGNKKFLTTAFLPQFTWPYGKSLDDPTGRFSDGKIVPDFVASFLGIPNAVPPALDPKADISRGASFAVAGASVLPSPFESLTLSQQVLKFRTLRVNYTEKFLAESLFIFYIGAEDYLNFTVTNPTADTSAQQAFVTTVINKINSDLRNLYSLGARKFAFQMLGPLGCSPIVKQDYKTTNDECLQILNDLAVQHNDKIRPMLTALSNQLSGFQYTVFDFYQAMMKRLNRPSNYRYLSTNVSCCGIGSHNAFGCGKPNVHSNLCSYQRSYLYFDGQHNTEKTNEAISHLFFGADPVVVGPMNLRELITYPVGLNMLET